MRSRIRSALAVAFTLAVFAVPGWAEMKEMPTVRLHAQVQVNASPSAVWSRMTIGKNLVTWCPMWKNAKNAAANLTKVGDVLDYSDQWGNGGRSVVTYIVHNKEIRVAHEPTKGDYMCQAKLVLEPQGQMTMVHYWEQYTDESSPKDLQATAGKMQSEMRAMLAQLKSQVEGK
jgi:polyketide cyclase/dehydrase/lipid transport protein